MCNRSPLRAHASQPSAKCKTVPCFSLLPPQRLTASPVVIFGSSLMRLGSISPSKVGNLQRCSHSCTLRVRQVGDQWGFLLLHLAIRFLCRFTRFEPPFLLQPSGSGSGRLAERGVPGTLHWPSDGTAATEPTDCDVGCSKFQDTALNPARRARGVGERPG